MTSTAILSLLCAAVDSPLGEFVICNGRAYKSETSPWCLTAAAPTTVALLQDRGLLRHVRDSSHRGLPAARYAITDAGRAVLATLSSSNGAPSGS